jgi:hypothetical protein
MTVQQVNDAVSDMLTADVNWMRDHILAGLFYNGAGWTSPDPEYGDLTIQGLANGDTVTVYVKQGGAPATDTHYYAQAAAIADATNPYDDLYAELSEHPENAGGDVITFIASDQVATTEALAVRARRGRERPHGFGGRRRHRASRHRPPRRRPVCSVA